MMDQNYPTDFSPDERSFLCSPHAEEALAAARREAAEASLAMSL